FDQKLRAFRRRFEPDFADAARSGAEPGRQRLAAPGLFDRNRLQKPRAHSPCAPLSDPTRCAPAALVTRISSPLATTITSSSPITDTRGPSLSTNPLRHSTSSAFCEAELPWASPPRACCTALHEPISDHAMSAGTTAALAVCSITA